MIAVADQVAADQSLADQTSAFRPVQTRYMESMCRPGTNQIGVVHIRNPTRSAQEGKIRLSSDPMTRRVQTRPEQIRSSQTRSQHTRAVHTR